jgi:ATP-dependent RNA helicase DDX56/DBP9
MEASMQVPTSLLDEEASFDSFGIDERLLRAISKMGFAKPTLIQSSAIPLALQVTSELYSLSITCNCKGKDIVARARTGSGKTAAYSIPILQSLLLDTQKEPGVKALILVPTSELTEQVKAHFK